MIQALRKRDTEGGQLIPGYGEKVDSTLTAGMRVEELAAGGQGGGGGGKNLQVREKVGTDLQRPRRVTKLMDFVENDPPVCRKSEKKAAGRAPFLSLSEGHS